MLITCQCGFPPVTIRVWPFLCRCGREYNSRGEIVERDRAGDGPRYETATCVHLGEPTGRRYECGGCQHPMVIYQCPLHGECLLRKPLRRGKEPWRGANCVGCPDFARNDDAE